MKRRVLLIANKRSRRCADVCPEAVEALRAADFDVAMPELPDKSKLTALIEAEAPRADCIVVMGGDGSINAALPGVLKAGLPLGILPAGTANDLARTLNLPTDIPAAVRVIAEGVTKPVDVGSVNGHPFLNAASLGMSVTITRQLDRNFKRRWGVLAYAIAACRAIWNARAFHATVTTNGSDATVRTVQIVVGNGRYFGSGMTVKDTAQIDDGKLRLYCVRVDHWWSFVMLIPTLRRGTYHGDPRVYHLNGTDITVTTRRPRHISADGELLTQTPAHFTEQPGALQIYVPADAAGEPTPPAK
jgi:YegS/Rv2252/BmrU family lipid kinase